MKTKIDFPWFIWPQADNNKISTSSRFSSSFFRSSAANKIKSERVTPDIKLSHKNRAAKNMECYLRRMPEDLQLKRDWLQNGM